MAAQVVAFLRRRIVADFTRASLQPYDYLEVGGAECLPQRPTLTLDVFASRWALRGVLCAVLPQSQGPPSLHLRVTLAHPVAPPPA